MKQKKTKREILIERNTTHNLSYHPLYNIWRGMKERCTNPNHKMYKYYAKIQICTEWLDFKLFYDWAIDNGWKKGLTINRIDNKLGYNPDNCNFLDMKGQSRNRTNNKLVTAFGETKCLAEWAEDRRCVVDYATLKERINSGKHPESALTTPTKCFSKKERQFIKNNYLDMTDLEISQVLQRSEFSIREFRNRNDLPKGKGYWKIKTGYNSKQEKK